MAAKTEIRTIAASLRAVSDDKFVLAGRAVTYGALSSDLGGFRERVEHGAFTRTLASNPDVVCLFNHGEKNDTVLGRTTSGTLVVTSDEKGLNFRCQLDPNQQSHKDLYHAVKRGDIDACSWAFSLADGDDLFDTAVDERGKRFNRRTIRNVSALHDVSIVVHAAYPGLATSVAARSIGPSFQPQSKEQRFFAEHGRWPNVLPPPSRHVETLEERSARIAAQIRRDEFSQANCFKAVMVNGRCVRFEIDREAEEERRRFGTGIMSADEVAYWKRKLDIAMGLRDPEVFPWQM